VFGFWGVCFFWGWGGFFFFGFFFGGFLIWLFFFWGVFFSAFLVFWFFLGLFCGVFWFSCCGGRVWLVAVRFFWFFFGLGVVWCLFKEGELFLWWDGGFFEGRFFFFQGSFWFWGRLVWV